MVPTQHQKTAFDELGGDVKPSSCPPSVDAQTALFKEQFDLRSSEIKYLMAIFRQCDDCIIKFHHLFVHVLREIVIKDTGQTPIKITNTRVTVHFSMSQAMTYLAV